MEAGRQQLSPTGDGHLSPEVSDFYQQAYGPAQAGCLNELRNAGCTEEEAEEVFAATFEHVMRTVDPVARSFAIPQMVNLLKKACRRKLIDVRRHDGVLRRVPLGEVGSVSDNSLDTPEELVERHETVEIGREAVASLPDRDRRVFVHRHGHGLGADEILERMPDLTRRSYRRILQRANAKVLRAFEEIDSGARCRDMERNHLQRYVSTMASEDEVAAVEAHLQRCRACQQTVLEMRGYLDDVASSLAAMITGTASVAGQTHSNWIADAAARLVGAGEGLVSGTRSLRERLRDQALRAATSVPGSGGDAAAGQLIGASTMKVAAGCVAGAAATTAACVALSVSPLAVVGVTQDGPSPKPAERKAVKHPVRRAVIDPNPATNPRSRETPVEPAPAPPPTQSKPEKSSTQRSNESASKTKTVDKSPQGGGELGAGLEGAGRTPQGTTGAPPPEEGGEPPPEVAEGSTAASSGSATGGSTSSGSIGSSPSGGSGGRAPVDGGSELGL